jgi:hypothetical protein
MTATSDRSVAVPFIHFCRFLMAAKLPPYSNLFKACTLAGRGVTALVQETALVQDSLWRTVEHGYCQVLLTTVVSLLVMSPVGSSISFYLTYNYTYLRMVGNSDGTGSLGLASVSSVFSLFSLAPSRRHISNPQHQNGIKHVRQQMV